MGTEISEQTAAENPNYTQHKWHPLRHSESTKYETSALTYCTYRVTFPLREVAEGGSFSKGRMIDVCIRLYISLSVCDRGISLVENWCRHAPLLCWCLVPSAEPPEHIF